MIALCLVHNVLIGKHSLSLQFDKNFSTLPNQLGSVCLFFKGKVYFSSLSYHKNLIFVLQL